MAIKKELLPTNTIINYKSNSTVDIHLNYSGPQIPCNERMPHILSVGVSEIKTLINGININEGDLYAFLECYPDWVQLTVDANGNFVIVISNPDEDHYYIDENEGELWFDDTI